MDRRKALLVGAAGVAALTVPTWFYFKGSSYDPSLGRATVLCRIWEDGPEIQQIGKCYRELYPDEDRKRKLLKLLTGDKPEDEKALALAMEQQVQEDYRENRIVLIDGWMLSVTEARQCALFSIDNPIP
ncbi:hypothetical protein PP178_05415 [Zeaxanthinibacter sp. PT1]|uniref:hypothetical protein n=1 Tax=Zeaxanthinibacter TaxID=561554 RepID=UPI00234ABCF4|nr:hypothetical protein [Zeaxanthinibacter sp. PT1]MDC6350982.1 hypothetical protein [Zeaxanthinibacter sp. PT1]